MAVSTQTPLRHDTFQPEAKLSPPVARQPYTPPPRQGEDVESGREQQYELQTSNGYPNGSVGEDRIPRVDGIDDLAICASPAEYAGLRRRRKDTPAFAAAVKPQTVANMLRKGIVEHQLGLSLNLVLLLTMSWTLFPSLRGKLEAFFLLSYKSSRSEGQDAMYGQGPRDLGFVVGCIVVFTGLRAFLIDCVLTPLAGLWGIRNPRTRDRFAEQSFLLLYYVLYWNWGVFLFVADTPTLFPTSSTSFSEALTTLLISLWTDFPRLLINGSMKLYYLSQLAFWIQQIMVVHLEEKRKDHYQMLTHHFVTVALMSTSYCYRQWRVGSAVLACMDIIEIIFPSAKILKYLGFQTACDIAFGLFVVMWLIARHGCYLTICWSIYAHVNEVIMPYGMYSLKTTVPGSVAGLRLSPDGGDHAAKEIWQPLINPGAKTVNFNAKIRWGFLGLLLGLQCITLMWFAMICRVVVKVLRGEGADDTRSDDEGEDDEEEVTAPNSTAHRPPSSAGSVPFSASPKQKQRFIEVEVDSTNYVRRTPSSSSAGGGSSSGRRTKKGNGSFASGLNLGEHKEILNRIGCLSEEQLAREREKKMGER